MKERIETFYQDHKGAIFFTSAALAGSFVGALIVRRNFNRALTQAIEGGVITTVEPLIRGDGVSVILAHAQDGRTFYFAKDQ